MGRESAGPGATRHRWVFRILERAGSELVRENNGIYRVRLGNGLAEILGREELLLTFRKRLAGTPGVEPALPGSWLYDRLISYATSVGQVTRRYLIARENLNREAVVRRRRRDCLSLETLLERRYGTVLLFTFRVSFYAEPPRQSVRTIAFDCERGRVMSRPPGAKALREALPGPQKGMLPPPSLDTETAFQGAWSGLQDQVEENLKLIQDESRPYVQREIQTMERYYRQLIAEERRIEKARSTRKGQEESRRKLDLLKLEWERRVKQETERLRPRVVARLSAVAAVHVPLEAWAYRTAAPGQTDPPTVWIDLARADAWIRNGVPRKRKH